MSPPTYHVDGDRMKLTFTETIKLASYDTQQGCKDMDNSFCYCDILYNADDDSKRCTNFLKKHVQASCKGGQDPTMWESGSYSGFYCTGGAV
jgi:hypothetical protein